MRGFFFYFWILFFLSTFISAASMEYYDIQDSSTTVRSKAKLGKNKQQTKDQAIQDAFQNAITEIIQKWITNDKYELHYEAINENILSKAQRFIKRFVLQKQSVSGDNFEVEIELSIDRIKLKQALASLGLLFAEKNFYKALLMISITTPDDPAPAYWWSTDSSKKPYMEAYSALLAEPELAAPLVLLDPYSLSLNEKLPKNLKKLHLSTEELTSIGKILDTDLILFGTITIQGSRLPGNIVKLDLASSIQSYNVKTSRVVSNTNFSNKKQAPLAEVEKAYWAFVHSAAVQNIKKTTENVITTWVDGTFNATAYQLVILGNVNYQEFNQLKQFLKRDISSINSIEDSFLSRSRKVLTVESNFPLAQISQDLRGSRPETFILEPKSEDLDAQKLEFIFKRL